MRMSRRLRPITSGVEQPVVVGLAIVGAGLLGLAVPSYGMIVLGALFLAAMALVLLTKPTLGLFILTATLPLESVGRLGPGLTTTKILGVIVFGMWLLYKLLHRESWQPVVSTNLFKASIALLSLGLLSLVWATYPSSSYRGLLQLVQLLLWSALIMDLADSWDRVLWLVRILMMAALTAVILVLAQYFVGEVNRAGAGITGGINKTSALIVTVIPFAFYFIRAQGSRLWRSVGLLYLLLTPVAVLVTFARQSYLLMPLAVLTQYWETIKGRTGRNALFMLTALILVVAAVLVSQNAVVDQVQRRIETIVPYVNSWITGEKAMFYGRKYKSSGRGLHWRVGFTIFQDYPLLGAGYGNYGQHFLAYQYQVPGFDRYIDHARSPHSSYVGILADLGILGLVLWLVVLGVGVWNLKVAWSTAKTKCPQYFWLVQAVTYSTVLQILYGFAHNIHTQKLFWLLMALTVVIRRLAKQTDSVHDDANLTTHSQPSSAVANQL